MSSNVPGSQKVARVRALFARLDPAVLATAVVQLAEGRDVDDRVLVALQSALEVASLRRPSPDDWYAGGRFHRTHPLGFSELQKLRFPPTGDVELWIKYGPAGPLVEARQGAE